MRLMLIATSLENTSSGGDVFIRGLIRALASVPVDLCIVVPHSVVGDIARLAPRASVRSVRGARGAKRVLRDLLLIDVWARGVRPDWVIFPHEFVPFTAHRSAILLQNIASFSPVTRRDMGLRGLLLRALGRMRIPAADLVVSSSRLAVQVVGGSVSGLPRVAVIPPCVELPNPLGSSEATAAKRIMMPAKRRVLVVVGEWGYKNLAVVEAALSVATPEILDGLSIRIAGVGVGSLKGGEVLGKLRRSALLTEMHRSDLVIFPSRVESLGLPAIEAALSGVRPAVLAGSAMAEVLGDIALTFGDADELLQLLGALNRGTLYRVMDEEVAKLRMTLSAESVGSRWLDELQSVHG